MLAQLLRVEQSDRDWQWRQQFYQEVVLAALGQGTPTVTQGPDNFPYLQLWLCEPGPVSLGLTGLVDTALDQGYGAAIFDNPHCSGNPQWVFTYGDLLAYNLYGNFDGSPEPPVQAGSGKSEVLVAAPGEAFLPARARRVLARFLHEVIRLPQPKVCLVVDPQARPSRSIMVNLKLADFGGDETRLANNMRYLLWFFPRSHGLLAQPHEWDESHFQVL